MKCTFCGKDGKIVLDDGKNKICDACKDIFIMKDGKIDFIPNLREEWKTIYKKYLIN